MSSLLTRVGQRIHDAFFGPESGARVLVIQGGFMALFAARLFVEPPHRLTPQPPALFRPVPPISFLDQMPPKAIVIAGEVIVLLAVAAWFLVGRSDAWRARGRRIAYIVAWVVFLLLATLPASRGKIWHRDLTLIWASAPLMLAPTNLSFRDRTPTRRMGWPVQASIAFLSVCYFSTGYEKLRASGIDWIFSDNLQWALYWGRVHGDPPPWHSLGFFIADRPWLSQLSALFIVCFEVGFPLALFFKRVRPVWVVAAWLFHGGTFLMLGLDYWLWALVVTLVLVDWPKVVDRVRRQPVPAT